MALDDYPFIEARWKTRLPTFSRNVQLIVLHTMEAPEKPNTAEGVANYFHTLDRKASAHYCVDSDSVVQCVRLQDVAYAAPGANSNGVHIELAGYAAQSAADWSDEFSKKMLARAAKLAAELSARFNVPPKFLGATSLGIVKHDPMLRGFTTHRMCTQAYGGSHTDPGPNFPMTDFLNQVAAHLQNTVQPDATKNMPVYLSGKPLDVEIKSESGKTWVELRDFAEALGFDVKFDPARGIDLVPKSKPIP